MFNDKIELRDYFASAAIPVLLDMMVQEARDNGAASPCELIMDKIFEDVKAFEDSAHLAYQIADAMMFARLTMKETKPEELSEH